MEIPMRNTRGPRLSSRPRPPKISFSRDTTTGPSKYGAIQTGVGATVAVHSTLSVMSTQAQSRPLTRSLTANTPRRSARLRSTHDKHRPLPQSSSFPGQIEPDVRHGIRKRKKPLVLIGESRNSQSRKECGQIEVLPQPRFRQATSREKAPSGESSTRAATTAACSRASSRVKELEDQLDVALQDKEALAALLREHKLSLAQSALKHLEEYFTCPLCFEILAYPYVMTPRNCGHTFCATCILKWFFSRLHKGCGGWHEAVDCPLCRTALPHTPDRIPRSTASFPFTPNRTADIAIRGLMNTISHELGIVSTAVPDSLSEWNEDGHNKQEWSKRERAGRTEMTAIASQWNTLKPSDFINIKNRLEV